MDGTAQLIQKQLLDWGRGRIFFAQDFTMLGTPDSVRQALCTLTDERFIVRLARGVYCFPKVTGKYSIRTLLPSPEAVAEAVADRSRCRIVPYGDQAAYLMGFTGLQMGRYTYLTDGAPRRIGLGAQGAITFQHTSEVKIFSFCNATMLLLSLAIRAVGKDGITPEIRARIADRLTSVPEEDFQKDIKLCPAWVAELMFDV